MSNNCCDSSYYRTPFNVNYQNLYCNLAQSADTNLQDMVTSGYSYNRSKNTRTIRENYCGCGFSRVYNDSPMAEYYNGGRVRSTTQQQCPTDFLRTPYNIAYQQLYSGMANTTFTENYNGNPKNGNPKNVEKVTYFYSR